MLSNNKAFVKKRPLVAFLFFAGLILIFMGFFYFFKKEEPQAAPSLFVQTLNKNKTTSATETESASPETLESSTLNSLENDHSHSLQTKKFSSEKKLHLLQRIIQENDICLLNQTRFSNSDMLLALLSTPDVVRVDGPTDRMLLDLLTENIDDQKILNLPLTDETANTTIAFYHALILSGLIQGIVTQKTNDTLALEILNKLSREIPENAVFDFYAAFLMNRLNESDQAVKNRFRLAFSKPTFETYFKNITQRFYEKSLANTASYVTGITALSELPIPNLTAPYFLVLEIIKENDPQFNEQALQFAARNLQKTLPSLPFYDPTGFSVLELSTFRGIAKRSHPQGSELFANYDEVIKQLQQTMMKDAVPQLELINSIMDPVNCSQVESSENFIKQTREKLLRRLNSTAH